MSANKLDALLKLAELDELFPKSPEESPMGSQLNVHDVPFFSVPAPDFLWQFAALGRVVDYKAGECILGAHNMGEEFFLVFDGICQYQVHRRALNSIALVGSGGTIGEVSFFVPGGLSVPVYALTDVKVCQLRREQVEVLWQEQLSKEYLPALTEYMILKLSQLWKILSTFFQVDARERFFYFISSYISLQNINLVEGDYYELTPPLSQAQLADMLGVNRVTLSKIFRPLRKERIVLTQRKRMLIHKDYVTRFPVTGQCA